MPQRLQPMEMDVPLSHFRNAAIWYHEDAYVPDGRPIMGRRVAGDSFLKGFVKHADVDEFLAVTNGSNSSEGFKNLVQDLRPNIGFTSKQISDLKSLDPLKTFYYPGPDINSECWRRYSLGKHSYSICGITHTISSRKVLESNYLMRMSPQYEWDGIICTSRSVRDSLLNQHEIIEDYIKERFGNHAPPRPQLSLIPLGIDCDEFDYGDKLSGKLRSEINAGVDDVIILCLSRLTPHNKFDPFPLFLALNKAQSQLEGIQLHLVLCGVFADGYSERVFNNGIQELMPDVKYHLLDGADKDQRDMAWAGSDIFTFPIDNIQESFGISPIEAMASGLPVVTTDWDGMKDTITDDVGFRVPTITGRPEHSNGVARHYHNEDFTYIQYLSKLSSMTCFDVDEMANIFARLAKQPELRKELGAAGKRRARSIYDWSNIIPLMQDFWENLNAIRSAAERNGDKNDKYQDLPTLPSSFRMFSTYPTRQIQQDDTAYCLETETHHPDIKKLIELRNYKRVSGNMDSVEDIETVYAIFKEEADQAYTSHDLSEKCSFPILKTERIILWLMKFNYIKTRKISVSVKK